MFRTNKEVLSIEEIEAMVQKHKQEAIRYTLLQDYYLGNHKILEKVKMDADAPNNLIVNPYPKYITDMLTGYFIGQPVLYAAIDNSSEKDDAFLEALMAIYRANDEQEENLELARTCSIKGKAYEILWTDQEANPRFKIIQPEECFFIYDTSLEERVRFAVRHYQTRVDGDLVDSIWVYSDSKVQVYEAKKGQMALIEEKPHYFGQVPFVLYENNREGQGDFEPVLSLIDAYDLAQSNTLNDMEQFTDAYLVLVNMSGTTSEEIRDLKEKRTLLIDENGDAKWLVKDVNDTWVENYKNRLKQDIHKFSSTPDMTDENFGSNLSGVSLRYKLLAMEQIRANKERKFKKGLQRRIELLANYLKITNKDMLYTGLSMTFNNTLPQNILETAQIISTLAPFLSKETLIKQLPFVENAKEELERKSHEEEYDTDYKDLEKLIGKDGHEDQ